MFRIFDDVDMKENFFNKGQKILELPDFEEFNFVYENFNSIRYREKIKENFNLNLQITKKSL